MVATNHTNHDATTTLTIPTKVSAVKVDKTAASTQSNSSSSSFLSRLPQRSSRRTKTVSSGSADTASTFASASSFDNSLSGVSEHQQHYGRSSPANPPPPIASLSFQPPGLTSTARVMVMAEKRIDSIKERTAGFFSSASSNFLNSNPSFESSSGGSGGIDRKGKTGHRSNDKKNTKGRSSRENGSKDKMTPPSPPPPAGGGGFLGRLVRGRSFPKQLQQPQATRGGSGHFRGSRDQAGSAGDDEVSLEPVTTVGVLRFDDDEEDACNEEEEDAIVSAAAAPTAGGGGGVVRFDRKLLVHNNAVPHRDDYYSSDDGDDQGSSKKPNPIWISGAEYFHSTLRNRKEHEYEQFHRNGYVVEEDEFVLYKGKFVHPVHLPVQMWKV